MTDEPGDAELAPDDIELENALRRVAARADPVPPGLAQAALGAFAWRTIDADLAALSFDSQAAEQQDENQPDKRRQAALVRGGRPERLVSFTAEGLTIEAEVIAEGGAVRMLGQLMPPQPARIEVRHQDETVTTQADELGRFSAGPLRAGPVSLRCTLAAPGARPVVTDWIIT
ncbi:MAG: hypothetical protein ACLQDY_26115 [Streptosporangiaceae bacterium]